MAGEDLDGVGLERDALLGLEALQCLHVLQALLHVAFLAGGTTETDTYLMVPVLGAIFTSPVLLGFHGEGGVRWVTVVCIP